MPDYDFRILSSYDFEILVRDLLQAEFGVRIESFKQGKDAGIDLRCANSSSDNFIVQCKHFVGSGLAKLESHLAASEMPKIDRLAPSRYILATSVSLSAKNKNDLLRILAPHCKAPGDVFGREDLNNLLGRHPEVEKNHFKLWLSSATVLDRLLHSRIYTQTELALDVIQEKMSRYVQNASYSEALAILDELHYCIICGMPGIGKTMLADMLLVSLVGAGYEAIRISGTVDEALTLFKKGKPQAFYYDDFLGQTSLQQQKLAKNEDQQLLLLIDRVRQSDHHRFLLTTREYILAQAKGHYERLETSRFDVRKCVITLDKYSIRNRCKILFNHLYFSRMPKPYIDSLLASGAHREIVKHRNFNPRIVEWMTTILSELPSADDYGKEFVKNLDQPQRLWEHAYSQQLSAPAQILLLVIGTLSPNVLADDAEQAFTATWLPGGRDTLGPAGRPPFMSALKELDGTFIKSAKDTAGRIVLSFQSPSIRDFVEYKLRLDLGTAQTLLERIVFFEQVRQLFEVMRSAPGMTEQFMKGWFHALCRSGIRTLGSPGCTIVQSRTGTGLPAFSYAHFSVEERSGFLLNAALGAPGDVVGVILNDVISVVVSRWRQGQLEHTGVEEFLDAVSASPHIDADTKIELADLCARVLIGSNADLSTFRTFGELYRAQKIPSTATEVIEKVQDEFYSALESMIDVSGFQDSYSALEAIREAETVAKLLDCDISDAAERAREQAREIEDPDYDPTDDRPARAEAPSKEEDFSDKDIDEMFGAL